MANTDSYLLRSTLSFYLKQLDATRATIAPLVEHDVNITPDRIPDIHTAISRVVGAGNLVTTTLADLDHQQGRISD